MRHNQGVTSTEQLSKHEAPYYQIGLGYSFRVQVIHARRGNRFNFTHKEKPEDFCLSAFYAESQQVHALAGREVCEILIRESG